MATDGQMEYVTVIKKDGTVIQQVLDRGQHLCQNIYVAAKRMGSIVSDEEIEDGDCPPVHETGFVGSE